MANDFQVTSLDPDNIKDSLIEFIQTLDGFSDIDYEGSGINMLVDTLVRNAHVSSYEANMVANESFLDSAQIRGNVSAHAQRLSYLPRSKTAARLYANIEVKPTSNPNLNSVVAEKGKTFIRAEDGNTYTFTNPKDVVLFWDATKEAFVANDVELIQGQLISSEFTYSPTQQTADGRKIFIANEDLDTSTLRVFVKDSQQASREIEYKTAEDIEQLGSDSNVVFLGETRKEQYYFEFGRNILGNEPQSDSVVRIEYIATEDQHANGISQLIAGSTIEGYSNINVDVTTNAFGGYDKASADEIKFVAPRAYQTQNRAVRESDYEILIKEQFPFIQSVRSWGGEKNDPPYYGKVFVAVVPEQDIIITEGLKRQIRNYIEGKNVTAITVDVVEPVYIDIELNAYLIINKERTNVTFDEAVETVNTQVEQYAEQLLNFGEYYNNSYLVNAIKEADPGVESIWFDKKLVSTKSSVKGKSHRYTTRFKNAVETRSVLITGVRVSLGSTDTITDDGKGNLVLTDSEREVGTVDYDNGTIQFTVTNLDDGEIRVEAVPDQSNVFTDGTNILRLNQPQFEQQFRTREV